MNKDMLLDVGAFESELKKQGLVTTESESNQSISSKEPLKESAVNSGYFSEGAVPLSTSEQRAWMQHQHDPLSASGVFISAFQLQGNLDSKRLENGILSLFDGNSNLNSVFVMNSNGQVEKRLQTFHREQIFGFKSVSSLKEVEHFLLEQQNQPLDLEVDPSIRFWLFRLNHQNHVLGVLGHHILLDDSAWQAIIERLNSVYKTGEVDSPRTVASTFDSKRKSQHSYEQYWRSKFADGLTRIELVDRFFQRTKDSNEVYQYGKQSSLSLSDKASRFYTFIDSRVIHSVASSAQSTPFQAVLTKFGQFLTQEFETNSCDVLVPTIESRQAPNLDQLTTSSNVIPIRIPKPSDEIISDIQGVRDDLLRGMDNNLPIESIFSTTKTSRHQYPNVLATQVDDISRHFQLEGVHCQQISLLPLRSDYDLTLAFRYIESGYSMLELTTNEKMSQYAGGYWLEKFVVFLNQESNELLSKEIETESAENSPIRVSSEVNALEGRNNEVNQAKVKAILNSFRHVLEQPNLTENEDFFEVGGHSLLATQVIGSLASEHRLKLDIADFFEHGTAKELAQYVTEIADIDSLPREENDETQTPSTLDIEAKIREVFCQVLGNKDVEANSDFFELGGHSLLATRVIGDLKSSHGIELAIADFFETPTSAQLAEKVLLSEVTRSGESAPNTPTNPKPQLESAPLSLLQQSYMAIAEMGRNPLFNIPFAIQLKGKLNSNALKQAMHHVLIRHHALRTLVQAVDENTLQQTVVEQDDISNYQWFWGPKEFDEQLWEEVLASEAFHSFDLTSELPIRVKLLETAENEYLLSLLIYHSVFDEWSASVFIEDLVSAYNSTLQGHSPRWQFEPAQFTEYAVEQSEHFDLQGQLEFWRDYLGLVEPQKPLFGVPESTEDNLLTLEMALAGGAKEIELPTSSAQTLHQNARETRSSIFYASYAAIATTLYLLGSEQNLLIGTSVFGRENHKYQNTVGLFTNVLMHKVQLGEVIEFKSLIKSIQHDILQSLPYSETPFGLVELEVAASPLQGLADNLCEFYVQYHPKNGLDQTFNFDDGSQWSMSLLEPERLVSKFGLHFEIYETEDSGLRFVLNYRKAHYDESQIDLIANTLLRVIETLSNASKHTNTIRDIRREISLLEAKR